jgi:hypothetical protein
MSSRVRAKLVAGSLKMATGRGTVTTTAMAAAA